MKKGSIGVFFRFDIFMNKEDTAGNIDREFQGFGVTVRQSRYNRQLLIMRINLLIMAALMLLGVSCDQSHVRQARTPVLAGDSEMDQEIRRVMEKGINLEERKSQIPAIVAAFSLRTDLKRARRLAALCYLKTLGTPFKPIDLAEIALAETGSHGLSGTAVSSKGALGVWQLMPSRAQSHGYSPEEMRNDEKCAEAAVRELASKLAMAKGDLVKAKKFYCGVGPEADQYEVKRIKFRKEILDYQSGFKRADNVIVAAGTSS